MPGRLWELMRVAAHTAPVGPGRAGAGETLALLDAHLAGGRFLVGDAETIADIAVYAYAHVAPDAGIDVQPYAALRGWLARVAAEPGFMDDLEPYPPNARAGASRSVYD